jgi:hypothetical protein
MNMYCVGSGKWFNKTYTNGLGGTNKMRHVGASVQGRGGHLQHLLQPQVYSLQLLLLYPTCNRYTETFAHPVEQCY